jgi:hypothetical protein
VTALFDGLFDDAALFTSFGTCSVLDPVDDLVDLGLRPSRERITA